MNITIFYNFTIYENHDQRILFLIRNFDSWDGRFDVRLVLISNRALKSQSRKEKKVVRHIELILKVVSQRSRIIPSTSYFMNHAPLSPPTHNLNASMTILNCTII